MVEGARIKLLVLLPYSLRNCFVDMVDLFTNIAEQVSSRTLFSSIEAFCVGNTGKGLEVVSAKGKKSFVTAPVSAMQAFARSIEQAS